MVTTSRPDATFFSVPQLKTITAWGVARPRGFSVRIMTDHEDYPELAELYTHDSMSPLWFLNATQAGTAVITKASGADQEPGTVEEALARVLELEKPKANAQCNAPYARPCAASPKGAIMLTENTDVPGVASTALLLSSDEASQFGALERILPEGWIVELQADPDMAWAAFV